MNIYNQKKTKFLFNTWLGFLLLFSLPVSGKVWSLQDSSSGQWSHKDEGSNLFHFIIQHEAYST